MVSLPLSKRLEKYLKTRNIDATFYKQLTLFLGNPFHPSLRTEVLEPKHLHLYSFRVTRAYRAIFIWDL